ncbi:MAG: S1C family serine protease [Prochloraceae cyanobacterium]
MRMRWIGILIIGFFLQHGTIVKAETIAEIFKRVNSSVVVVRTTKTEAILSSGQQSLNISGFGSGVLISKDGKVVTAAHLVQTAEQIVVEFPNGELIPARVVSSAPPADVSLLQLERLPAQAVVAKLGNSERVEVGEQIFIVGAPLRVSQTLTVGYISARRNSKVLYGNLLSVELLQTDAAINVGNSGGPMFNLEGEVIGIVTHMLSRSGSYEGLGFAVSSNATRELLLEKPTAWLGLESYLLSEDLASIFNLPQSMGILVQRIAQNSPAAKFGLQAGTTEATVGEETLIVGGDVILALDGIEISESNLDRIERRLRQIVPGQKVTMTIFRSGQKIKLTAPLIP